MNCTWNGRENPRLLVGRHLDDCQGEPCKGCQPCTEGHCRICRLAHADGTCPECVALTREALHEIGRLCDSLPEEVEHRGIDGEAMMLLGPAADPEARGWVEASYLAGRLPEGWIEAAHGNECPLLSNEACTGCAGGELHPYTVLGTWDMAWRDALEHDEPTGGRLALADAIDYLDRQLTYMAGFAHLPFEDFAANLRACRAYMERVLHDGEQHDTGAPCLECGVRQEREWGKLITADGWRCPKCKTFSTEAQYRLAVGAEHLAKAEWLTAADLAAWLLEQAVETEGAVVPVSAGTIRSWASKGRIHKRRDSGRTVYNRADVLEVATVEVAEAMV